MTLRKQLLLISLITLILPWAGLQYIKEMEKTLQQGQAQSLIATATAVSAYLSRTPKLSAELSSMQKHGNNQPIYIHPLPSAAIVDGYDDEWSALHLSKQQIGDVASPAKELVAGEFDQYIYLYIHIDDHDIRYFNPSLPSPTFSDHILLNLNQKQFFIFASGPGLTQAAELITGKALQPAYPIHGVWIESNGGYQIELNLPKSWVTNAFGIQVFDYQTGIYVQNYETSPPLPVRRSTTLQHALEIFQKPGLRMAVSTPNSKLIASNGSTQTNGQPLQHGFISWFYRTVIGTEELQPLDNPQRSGQFETPEIAEALSQNKASLGWYREHGETLVRASAPIEGPEGQMLGAIVLDQNADSLETITSGAFYRLLFYSLITTSLAGGLLVVYATWLSLRIRKLSQAAASAVSDSGKITEQFPVLKNRDEIGDLSRNYAGLLSRLREYTQYLRTLSSKLSHELRTPLAIVHSSLDNLELECKQLPPQVKVYAARAKAGSVRLSKILNAMSAASRVEQAISQAELDTTPCDELLRNLHAAYQDAYPKTRFTLTIEKPDTSLECLAAGELIVQMLDKLVDNAADFCPESGKITLGLRREGDEIIFSVQNDGPPLPEHMQGQLFDSMVSMRDEQTQQKHKNRHHLGLGLYIVRLIVDFHKGEVQGYNTTDQSGVVFEVRLPVKPPIDKAS